MYDIFLCCWKLIVYVNASVVLFFRREKIKIKKIKNNKIVCDYMCPIIFLVISNDF